MKSTLAHLKKSVASNAFKKKAIRQVKKRMLIINLNMRPKLPLPDELISKINHTALMSELKEYKPPKYRNFYGLRNNELVNILSKINIYPSKVEIPKYHLGLKGNTYARVFKKEALQRMLDINNVEWYKSWSVNRLMKEYISL